MQIVSLLVGSVDALFDHVPALDDCRPSKCPLCGHLAHGLGQERVGLVGHGTYARWVCGLQDVWGVPRRRLRVRRFLCRGCERTISVLPEWLHPRRWYGAWVILEALLLQLILGSAHSEVSWRFRGKLGERGWRSLTRWRHELLAGLWSWLAEQLGATGQAATAAEGRRRLMQLLAHGGEGACTPGGGARAAPRLLVATAHAAGTAWPVGREAPGALRAERLGERDL